jgi:hypothetical protein
MKKTLDKEALKMEASFWEAIKKASRENTGKVCRK